MNKSLIRLVALLLVPALIAEPVAASGLINTLAPSGEKVVGAAPSAFLQQALELKASSDADPAEVLHFHKLYFVVQPVSEIILVHGRA